MIINSCLGIVAVSGLASSLAKFIRHIGYSVERIEKGLHRKHGFYNKTDMLRDELVLLIMILESYHSKED